MKNVIVMTAVAVILAVGGCGNGSGNDSQMVTQLKLEKAQIVKEFNETKAQMQTQIDEQGVKIAALEAKVAEQKNTIDGYNKIMFDVIPKNQALKKQVDELTSQINALKNAASTDPAKVQEGLDKLKSLQQKAVEQQKQ